MAIVCPYCGKKLPDEAVACPYCEKYLEGGKEDEPLNAESTGCSHIDIDGVAYVIDAKEGLRREEK